MIGDPIGYVYFVKHYSKVKIGFSTKPDERMQHIGCGTLFSVIPNVTMQRERLVHRQFSAYRTNPPRWAIQGKTEWFRITPSLMAFIERCGSKRLANQFRSPTYI